jgi:hypothetical protein
MNENAPLIEEFIARKEQVLNLETRLFVIVFALELVFVLFYFYWRDKLQSEKTHSIVAFSVYLVLFFEMIAINGKMGLISMYLKQLESFLTSAGYAGLVWESKALRMIIFVPGNAFTLPAFFTIVVLLCQTIYACYFTNLTVWGSRRKTAIATIGLGILILFIVMKTVTVDFYRNLPNIF